MATVPNGPSNTGNPSKNGRGFFALCLVFSLFFTGYIKTQAQDKTYEFIGLKINYPAECRIFDSHIEEVDGRRICSFFISYVSADGVEERMKVHAEGPKTISEIRDLEDYEGVPSGMVSLLDMGPRYSHVEEEMSGEGKGFYYADYSAYCFYGARQSYSSTLQYMKIRGRIVVKVVGGNLVIFTIEGPENTNFSMMQRIINSLSYRTIFG